MSYIKSDQFENDIFLSYAWIDNQTLMDNKGWVNQFKKYLHNAITQRIGRNVINIWWDQRLGSNRIIDNTIKEALRKSVLFIAVISRGFLHPD